MFYNKIKLKKSLKKKYFTQKNIDKLSRKWLKKILRFRKRHFKVLDIKQSVLLVIDFQNYFTKASSNAFIPSSKAIINKIINLVNFFIENKRPVIFSLHEDKVFDNNLMLKWWKHSISECDLILPDNKILTLIINLMNKLNKVNSYASLKEMICNGKSSQLIEIVNNIYILKKYAYDAFYKTELEKFLKEKEIKDIVASGVMTHLCCETTIRSAFIRGFNVYFPIDATATYNKKFHLATFYNLSHGFSIPVLSEEIIKKTLK